VAATAGRAAEAPTISTGGAEFPVHRPPLRPLTGGQDEAAVAEQVAAFVRVLLELPAAELVHYPAVLRDVVREWPASPYKAVLQELAHLVQVVDANPDAATRVAEHLQES
jgi:hypothetical protein